MTSADNAGPPSFLKSGPLYAFSLPQELLQVIQLRSSFGGPSESQTREASSSEGEQSVQPLEDSRGDGSALRCSLCSIAQFESIGEQRAHFSSDWHRYNIKRNLAGKAPVQEQEWETMVEGVSSKCTSSRLV